MSIPTPVNTYAGPILNLSVEEQSYLTEAGSEARQLSEMKERLEAIKEPLPNVPRICP